MNEHSAILRYNQVAIKMFIIPEMLLYIWLPLYLKASNGIQATIKVGSKLNVPVI